jgi:hypothetical protein
MNIFTLKQVLNDSFSLWMMQCGWMFRNEFHPQFSMLHTIPILTFFFFWPFYECFFFFPFRKVTLIILKNYRHGYFDNSMSVLCGFGGIQVHLFYECGSLGAGEQKPSSIQSKD